jgi:hypothetical protein
MRFKPFYIVVLTVLILSIIQVYFALFHYPLMGSDAIAFIPAAINFSNGDGLINNVYHLTRWLNGPNQVPHFINYPPVFPLFMGYLLKITGNIHINFALIHIVLMIIFSLFTYQINKKVITWRIAILLALMLFAWNTQLNPGIGRPEALAELWMLMLAYCLFLIRHQFKYFLIGILIALTVLTHPVGGIYSLLLTAIYFSFYSITRVDVVKISFGGLFGILAVLFIYPHKLLSLLNGISRTARIVNSRDNSSLNSFVHYHVTYPEITFYFLVFLLTIFLLFISIKSIYNRSINKYLFIATLSFFFMTVLYFTFQTMEASYNLYVLFPFFCLTILVFVLNITSLPKNIIIGGIILTASLGFFRRLILFPVHVAQGVLYYDAKNKLDQIDFHSGKVFVETSMFTLFNAQANLTDDINDSSVHYLLVQQNFSQEKTPDSIPGFTLNQHTYNTGNVTLCGIKLASSIPGYSFALYERK